MFSRIGLLESRALVGPRTHRRPVFFPLLILGMMSGVWGVGFSDEAQAQRGVVKLELVMGPGFEPADAHQWLRVLGQSKADDIKIRKVRPTDKVEIKNLGTRERPIYVVFGELLASQRLRVPGQAFTIGQMEGLAVWVEELRLQGLEGVLEEKLAFGLTSRQLLDLHEDLARQVEFETQGREVAVVVRELSEAVETQIQLSSAARRAFAKSKTIDEEYQGMSVGTSLAASLRPLGLVAAVGKDADGKTIVRVVDSRDSTEFWPIGWPIEGGVDGVVPELSEKIKVEINDFQLKSTLDAIEGKLGLRFFYDQNALAQAGIDLTEVKVSYTHESAPYRNILRRVLSQTRPGMTFEVRQDENDKPFLWLTTRATR
jgi:hypothetical protein